mmetsp:Transcript_3411/g.3732  ORF Transcript_3411/g.3732 Transcript_3411/m.3732 type:complete len:626 (-) Transcript_3411:378-2255(-)
MALSVDGRSEAESEGGGSQSGKERQENIGRIDIFLLGVTAVLSGQVTAWASATEKGFWVLLAGTLASTLGYVILTFCVAEMTSALPFSGGLYGFVRAFTSPLLGFVVAVFELIINVFYVSPAVYLLASIPAHYFNMPDNLTLVMCFFIYVVIGAIILVGGSLFWQFNRCLGTLVLLLFVVYILGSSPYANFDKWGKGSHYHDFDTFAFFKQMPLLSTAYLGMQLLPLSSRLTAEPKKDVPIAMNTMMAVGCAITISLIITTCSQYPGIDSIASIDGYPLTDGFSRIFNLSYNSATCLNIPALIATTLGFTYFSARQVHCMANSGLIPSVFKRVLPSTGMPHYAVIAYSSACFLLNVLIFTDESFMDHFYLVTSLSSFIVYMLAFFAYISFKDKYACLERYFASPLGIPGAYVGIFIFFVCFVGGVGFQKSYIPGVTIIAVVIVSVIYFVFFSTEHHFSEEEKNELFKAYLVNANLATKKRLQKRGQIVPTLASKTRMSETSALNTQYNSIIIDEGKSSLIEAGVSISHIQRANSREQCPEKKEKAEKNIGNEECSVKVNQVSSSEVVSSHLEGRCERNDIIKKSFSEKIIQYISSKMNQISPDPIHQFEILQSTNFPETNIIDNV